MEIFTYEKLGETLYKDILPNGLTAYYLPKPSFHKTYGLFTTAFGSLDTEFGGLTYPEGIAHFLEHKLFEKEDGDVMDKFSALGAYTNAFTSFNRTSYLFSATENIEENVRLLLDFVQTGYFTDELIAKEQGIITQEIQMYQDEPDWRLFAGLLASLYPDSPLAYDIAGTPESISRISSDMLMANHTRFYQPANLTLFVTGPFEVETMSELVRQNQVGKNLPEAEPIERSDFQPSPAELSTSIEMDIYQPKVALGLRGEEKIPLEKLASYRLAIQLFLNLNFGKTSQFYEVNYTSGLIDESFTYEIEFDSRFHCVIFSADAENPAEVIKLLQERLKSYKIESDWTKAHLELIKRQLLGSFYRSLNSLEFIANEFSSSLSETSNLFDFPEELSLLTLEKIEKISENFLSKAQKSVFTILPK